MGPGEKPLTVTGSTAKWPSVSLTVIDVLPLPVPTTVNVTEFSVAAAVCASAERCVAPKTLATPMIAIAGFAVVAVKAPVYPASATENCPGAGCTIVNVVAPPGSVMTSPPPVSMRCVEYPRRRTLRDAGEHRCERYADKCRALNHCRTLLPQ